MAHNIFISYSRRELGFVDDLTSKLESKGYNVWLDYRVLIPGTPWAEQIDKGLREADTVLLVVSKASLASQFVELEWRHFLETNKRVILLIFEAVDLPRELEKYEWVDFRGSYQAGLDELFSQLQKPIVEEHPVPETGFKAPGAVWAVIAFSVVVAIISLGAFWTLFIPIFLVPLPYRIYKRSFDFMQVQAALAMLPVALTLSALVYINNDPPLLLQEGIGLGLGLGVWGWLLLYVLRQPFMQRWGKPESNVPRFADPQKPTGAVAAPVSFFIDNAPQDRAVANDLRNALTKAGHPEASSVESARSVFVLISAFKSDTDANPNQQVVFPVMLQTSDYIAPKLSKIQWIDFRPGVRGLEVIAELLPSPTALLKALGMRPVSAQTVYPPMITTLYFFTILLTVLFAGATLDYLFFSGISNIIEEGFELVLGGMVIGLGVFAGLAFLMIRSLISRTGLFSTMPALVAGLAVMGALMFGQSQLDNYIYTLAAQADIALGLSFAYFGTTIYAMGLVVLAVVFLSNRHDLRRWFPARAR